MLEASSRCRIPGHGLRQGGGKTDGDADTADRHLELRPYGIEVDVAPALGRNRVEINIASRLRNLNLLEIGEVDRRSVGVARNDRRRRRTSRRDGAAPNVCLRADDPSGRSSGVRRL